MEIYIYIYIERERERERVILIKKKAIFTIFLQQILSDRLLLAVTRGWAKKLFKLWIKIRINNNLSLMIRCKISVKIL